jgi:TonB family protein
VGDQPSQFEVTKNRDEKPFGTGVPRVCGPVVAPRVLKEVQPNYSPEGIGAKIQGRVLLDAIVGTDGKVRDVRIVYGLEPSLNREAVEAAKKWRFAPATSNGAPIATIVSIEMSFTLTR